MAAALDRTIALLVYDGKVYLTPDAGELHPFEVNDRALQGSNRSYSVDDRHGSGHTVRIHLYEAAAAPEEAVACDVSLLRTGPRGGLHTSAIFRFMKQATIQAIARHVVSRHVIHVAGCRHYQTSVLACMVAHQQNVREGKATQVKVHRADRTRSRGAKKVLYKQGGVELELGCIPRDYMRRVRANTWANVVGFYRARDGSWGMQIEAAML